MNPAKRGEEDILKALSDSTGVAPKKVKERPNTQARIEKYFEKESVDKKGFEHEVRRQTQVLI